MRGFSVWGCCTHGEHPVCRAPSFQVWSLWGSCHWGPLWGINGRQRRAKKRTAVCVAARRQAGCREEADACSSVYLVMLSAAVLHIFTFLPISVQAASRTPLRCLSQGPPWREKCSSQRVHVHRPGPAEKDKAFWVGRGPRTLLQSEVTWGVM